MQKRPPRLDGTIAIIPLTKGYEAIVDADDLHLVEAYSWTALVKPGVVYAKRAVKVGDRTMTVRMHRVILSAHPDALVDHINGNGLDNRKANLRVATNSQNLANRGAQRNNTSGFKGVTWNKAAGKWQASLKLNGNRWYLGLHNTAEDASAAYQEAARRAFGEFAR